MKNDRKKIKFSHCDRISLTHSLPISNIHTLIFCAEEIKRFPLRYLNFAFVTVSIPFRTIELGLECTALELKAKKNKL